MLPVIFALHIAKGPLRRRRQGALFSIHGVEALVIRDVAGDIAETCRGEVGAVLIHPCTEQIGRLGARAVCIDATVDERAVATYRVQHILEAQVRDDDVGIGGAGRVDDALRQFVYEVALIDAHDDHLVAVERAHESGSHTSARRNALTRPCNSAAHRLYCWRQDCDRAPRQSCGHRGLRHVASCP